MVFEFFLPLVLSFQFSLILYFWKNRKILNHLNFHFSKHYFGFDQRLQHINQHGNLGEEFSILF